MGKAHELIMRDMQDENNKLRAELAASHGNADDNYKKLMEARAERDALRAQVAEKDAALEKMDGDARWTISDVEHDLTDMRLRAEHAEAERDALRELLVEARHEWLGSCQIGSARAALRLDVFMSRIDAALKGNE